MATTVKKLTITIDTEVYEGLHRVVGRGNIGSFLSRLARPYVVEKYLDNAYAEMARDERREKEANVWSESLVNEIAINESEHDDETK